MTTDITIMEEMLERATNPSGNVDELGVQMFCLVAKNNVQKAQELIVSKVQSRNITESTRAIALLEECMAKCGNEFQDQIGKFRFLNYLIRMVSKNYDGATTPQPIKQRIMECLLLWTTAYPQKEKIREAYDNLNREGGVEHGNTTMSVASVVRARTQTESILGDDEEVLKKLLQSKDPEDYKRANLLIQYRVNQEARRNEFRAQQKSELLEAENIAQLLTQMLDTYEADGSETDDASDTVNLMRELYIACKRHKPILQRLIELNDTNNSSDNSIGDILDVNDALLSVMKRYKGTIVYQEKKNKMSSSSPPSSTVANTAGGDLLSASITTNATEDLLTTLLDDILPSANALTSNHSNSKRQASSATSKTLEELNEIFGSLSQPSESVANDSQLPIVAQADMTAAAASSPLFGSMSVLEPIALEASSKSPVRCDAATQQAVKRALREMPEINALSDELFKRNLPAASVRLVTFKKDAEKQTLNDLVKEGKMPLPLNQDGTPPTSISTTQTEVTKEVDDIMLSGVGNKQEPVSIILDAVTVQQQTTMQEKTKAIVSTAPETTTPTETNSMTIPHLSDICIELDDILESEEERVILDDDDMKITLNFTANRPSKNVSVLVLSVENKSKFVVSDFQFEASVKKPNKIRILAPSDVRIPPYKRFQPPMRINQILLLFNPTEKPVDVTCILGYKIGDDPDPIKESILVQGIPFIE